MIPIIPFSAGKNRHLLLWHRFNNKLLLLLFLAHPIFSLNLACAQTNNNSKHNTLAHQVIELESELGFPQDFKILDSIINVAIKRIKVTSQASIYEAAEVLSTIDNILANFGFVYSSNSVTLSQTFMPVKNCETAKHNNISFVKSEVDRQRTSQGYHFHYDCDTGVIIFLSIAEILELPLHMVCVPSHAFLRWEFPDGTYFNWDVTAHKVRSDKEFMQDFHLAKDDFKQGVFLKSLDRNEVLGICYVNRALAWINKGETKKAFFDLDMAIKLNPLIPHAYYNRGYLFHAKKSYSKAVSDYSSALYMYNNYTKAYLYRGMLFQSTGKVNEALEDYNAIIKLDPKMKVARINRAAIYYNKGLYNNSISDYSSIIKAYQYDFDAHLNRGLAYFAKGDCAKAYRDYIFASKIKPNNLEALNNLAWLYINSEDPNWLKPEVGLKLSLKAVSVRRTVANLDTLAMGYAKVGDFENALKIENEILSKVSEDSILKTVKEKIKLFSQSKTVNP